MLDGVGEREAGGGLSLFHKRSSISVSLRSPLFSSPLSFRSLPYLPYHFPGLSRTSPLPTSLLYLSPTLTHCVLLVLTLPCLHLPYLSPTLP